MTAATGWLLLLGGRALTAGLVAAVLAVAVWVLLRAVPSLPPWVRAGLWWLVGARVLLELAGVPALDLAWLPAAAGAVHADAVVETSAPIAGSGPTLSELAVAPVAEATPPADPTASGARPIGRMLGLGLSAVWLALGLGALGRAGLELARLRARIARATPVGDAATLRVLDGLRRTLGIRRRVGLVASPEIESPLVYGLTRPTVALPALRPIAGEELALALAHELAHVRRLDAAWSWAPLLAERLFCFHPSLRLAAREYALATEAACDALVLERLAPAPERYGRLLLRMATGPATDPPVAAWPLARRPLERRLDMLTRTLAPSRPTLGAVLATAVLAALVLIPVRLVAAVELPLGPTDGPRAFAMTSDADGSPAVQTAPQAPQPEASARAETAPSPAVTAAPAAPATPATAPAPAALPAPAPVVEARPAPAALPAPAPVVEVRPAPPALPALAPVAPPAPAAAPSAVAAVAPRVAALPGSPLVDGGDLSLVLIDGSARIQIDAPAGDRDLARRVADDNGGRALVYRDRDDGRHVVRDGATIDRVRRFFDQETALRERQVRQIAERARRQAEAGRRVAARAAEQAQATAQRLAELDTRTKETLQAEMERLQSQLASLQAELERTQRELQQNLEPRLERELSGLDEALPEALEGVEAGERWRSERLDRLHRILESAPESPTPPPDRP